MKIVVVGMGVQGKKRKKFANDDFVASVDPFLKDVDYKCIKEVSLSSYDAALICVPDEEKFKIIEYCLQNKKHVLVEKPLISNDNCELKKLETLAKKNKVVCYTAYNHRFEPAFCKMKELLSSNKLGKIYHCRMFYGNGTARLFRESPWRDKGAGVLPDLGSHLLDTLNFWFGVKDENFALEHCNRFENKSPDHVIFSNKKTIPNIQCEMTLLSWRNHFTCDVFAEKGTAHISSLCKWGPSSFTYRKRILPSGRPVEETMTLVKEDPTWEAEYEYFKLLCKKYSEDKSSNLHIDIWINTVLNDLSKSIEASHVVKECEVN